MVLFLRIFICISCFVFNTFTFCTSTVKTENSFLTTVKLQVVNTEVSSVVWQQKQVTNLTSDCSIESDRNNNGLKCRDSTAVKSVSKRSVTVLNKNLTDTNLTKTNLSTTNLTTSKSKLPKSVVATTKTPPNVTKPPKSVQKNNLRHREGMVWPKPDKRLSDYAHKTPNFNASNHTEEIIVMSDFNTKYPIDTWKAHGFYTDDYMKLINSHWLKFMPPNATSHYILGVLYSVIMVLGCFGNSLVIFMYIKLVKKQTLRFYNFIRSLFFSDVNHCKHPPTC